MMNVNPLIIKAGIISNKCDSIAPTTLFIMYPSDIIGEGLFISLVLFVNGLKVFNFLLINLKEI